MKMGILTTLFASNEVYLSKQVNGINKTQMFPIDNHIDNNTFFLDTCDDSIVISGGCDEERSAILFGLLRCAKGSIVILHNGNSYFSLDRLKRYGLDAYSWNDIYEGLSRNQILSALNADPRDDDLAFFYSYAFDVCEFLNKPISIHSLNSIDWLSMKWQQELLSSLSNRDEALDLLRRFDKNMAEKAARATARLERLSYSSNGSGDNLTESLKKNDIIIKEVYGSHSSLCKQCLELIQAEAEKGKKFTLVLDDIYLDMPIIRDNFRNVRLIISGEDITQYANGQHFTDRQCSVVAFNHSNYGSCKALSDTYFGEYDKIYSEMSSGYSKSFLAPRVNNKTVTIRRNREARLKPEWISSNPFGTAFVRLHNGMEGYISIA